MKNFIVMVIMVLCLAFFYTFSLIAAPPDAYLAREGGDIKGSISYCDQAGSEGIEAYIPGTSFLARTDASGQFRISYVPPGTWNLVFAKNGKKLGAKNGVQVLKTNVTVIEPVVICNDMDGDGFLAPEDCDDNDPTVYPGAPEICGDGKDNNCNGLVDENCPPQCTDKDGDGYYAEAGCGTFVDCNDNNAFIHPGAQEVCNGIDDNCDGRVDEEGAIGGIAYYRDLDGDGYGDDSTVKISCNPPGPGWVTIGGDFCGGTLDNNPELYVGAPCDGPDSDLCRDGTYICAASQLVCAEDPSTNKVEIPGDGIDNDCNPNTPD